MRCHPSDGPIGHLRHRHPPRVLGLGLAVVIVVLSGACGEGSDATGGTTTITAPVVASPGGDYRDSGGTAPPPIGVSTLDNVVLKASQIGDASRPTAIANRSGTPTLYVAEKEGRVKQINVDPQFDNRGNVIRVTYRVNNSPLLDISGTVSSEGPRGLLGLAFSLDGRNLYLDYITPEGTITVDEYRMNDDAVDLDSRRNVLTVEPPGNNRNGGQLAFGPDGFLYIGIGDGGSSDDPGPNGQDPKSFYGKILRIDPEGQTGDAAYSIPPGNPFRDGQVGLPEVWAFGFRNPTTFSWDNLTDDLWIGDIGEGTAEEINFLPGSPGGAGRGSNFGWPLMEGSKRVQAADPPPGHTPPLFEYDRSSGGCAPAGGQAYRGKAMTNLVGVYVYADRCVGELRLLLRTIDGEVDERGTGVTLPKGELPADGAVTTFGTDNDGEIFVASAAGGIYKLEAG